MQRLRDRHRGARLRRQSARPRRRDPILYPVVRLGASDLSWAGVGRDHVLELLGQSDRRLAVAGRTVECDLVVRRLRRDKLEDARECCGRKMACSAACLEK